MWTTDFIPWRLFNDSEYWKYLWNKKRVTYYRKLMQNLSLSQCMNNQSQAHVFAFWIKAFSNLISKTVVYKIAWYHKVYQINQPRDTNLLFLQGHLESNARLCFSNFRRLTWQGNFSEKYIFLTFRLIRL